MTSCNIVPAFFLLLFTHMSFSCLFLILSLDLSGSWANLLARVWKSGLDGSRSTGRWLLYIEMCFFIVVYLRCIVLQGDETKDEMLIKV